MWLRQRIACHIGKFFKLFKANVLKQSICKTGNFLKLVLSVVDHKPFLSGESMGQIHLFSERVAADELLCVCNVNRELIIQTVYVQDVYCLMAIQAIVSVHKTKSR